MARESSPGLDLSHGFIHLIRRHQLTESERIRELAAVAEANQNVIHKRILALGSNSTAKEKRPDAPLYARGKSVRTNQSDGSNTQLSRLPLLELGDTDKVLAAADIESFPVGYQELLKATIEDIRDVSPRILPKVAELLVERSYKDEDYEVTAAMLCAHIVQCEYLWQQSIAIPSYVFRRAMQLQCIDVLNRWTDFSAPSTAIRARRFGHFVQLAYQQVQPGGHKDDNMLGKVMNRLLGLLLEDAKNGHAEELSVLSGIFHESGADLAQSDADSMREMMAAIRDFLLDPCTSPQIRHMLLQIIELQAGHWKLSQTAKQFYFSS